MLQVQLKVDFGKGGHNHTTQDVIASWFGAMQGNFRCTCNF